MNGSNPRLPTIYLFLIGNLSFGGAIGRIFFGLSLFDIILAVVVVLTLYKKHLRFDQHILVPLALFCYGLSVSMLHILFDAGPGYRYLLAESRYYVYQVVVFYIFFSTKTDDSKLEPFLIANIVVYVLIYLLLREGTFIYNFFNRSLLEDNIRGLDFVDRVNGPPIIFITAVFYYMLIVNNKIRWLATALYIILLLLVYVKTGSRTGLILSILPFLFFFFKKRNIALLALPVLMIVVIPFFVSGIQAVRFEQMFNPLQDSSFLYRIINIAYMWDLMKESSYAWLTGFGIGSNYDIYLTGKDRFGYFLDNTFLTMTYKFGMIITAGYFIYLTRIFSTIGDLYLRFFVYLVVFIISVISYHFISNPVYLIIGLVLMNLSMNSKVKEL